MIAALLGYCGTAKIKLPLQECDPTAEHAADLEVTSPLGVFPGLDVPMAGPAEA